MGRWTRELLTVMTVRGTRATRTISNWIASLEITPLSSPGHAVGIAQSEIQEPVHHTERYPRDAIMRKQNELALSNLVECPNR